MNRPSIAVLLAASAVFLGGCASSVSDGDGQADLRPTDPSAGNGNPAGGGNPVNTAFRALFQASGGIFPYPYDAYFSGSADGTVNVPNTPFFPATYRDPGSAVSQPAINALDGFSTIARITARFEGAINPATLTPSNVIMLQVLTNAQKGVVGFVRPMVPGTDYSVGVSNELGSGGALLEITPLRPLAPKASYLVILLNGITSTAGVAASADTDYAAIRSQIIAEIPTLAPGTGPACAPIPAGTLRSLCQLTGSQFLLARAVNPALPLANIVLSFSFSTQSTTDTLALLNAAPLSGTDGSFGVVDTGLTTAILPGAPGISRIWSGTIRVPYYLTPPSVANPTAPLTAYWTSATPPPAPLDQNSRLLTRFNPIPARVATLDIPVIMTIPTVGGPGPNGWPVVVFQHGITRSRGDVLPAADSFSARGFATISIDLPLHGITPGSTFAALRQAGRERNFDVDYFNNTTGAPGPDGVIDSSGQSVLFLALSAPVVARDALRQGVLDLLTVVKKIPTIDYNNNGTPDFDPARIHVVGFSLGSWYAGMVLGLNSVPKSSALPAGAGGIANTLRESVFYGAQFNAALLAQNAALVPNSALYNALFRDLQAAVDAADPLNYASTMNQGGRRIYISAVVGGAPNPAGGIWAADTSVPNTGTFRLSTALGLTGITATTNPITGNGVLVKFNQGIHDGYLDPRAAPLQTVEMQTHIADFLSSNGASITIGNPAVIAP